MSQTTNPLADLYQTNGLTFARATENIEKNISWTPLKLFADAFVIFGQDSLYEFNIKDNISTLIGRKNPNGKDILFILKHLMSLSVDKGVVPKVYIYMPSTDIIDLFQPTRGTSAGIYGEILNRIYYEYEFTLKCDEYFKFSIIGMQSVKMDDIESFSRLSSKPIQPAPSIFAPPQTQVLPTPAPSVFGTQPPTQGATQPHVHSIFGTPATKPSFFGTSQFGTQGKDQPPYSMFGTTHSQFGIQGKDQPTYSIFGNQLKDQPKSMFGK